MEDRSNLLLTALIKEHNLLSLDLVYSAAAMFKQANDELVVDEEDLLHLTLLVHFRGCGEGALGPGQAFECRSRPH